MHLCLIKILVKKISMGLVKTPKSLLSFLVQSKRAPNMYYLYWRNIQQYIRLGKGIETLSVITFTEFHKTKIEKKWHHSLLLRPSQGFVVQVAVEVEELKYPPLMSLILNNLLLKSLQSHLVSGTCNLYCIFSKVASFIYFCSNPSIRQLSCSVCLNVFAELFLLSWFCYHKIK